MTFKQFFTRLFILAILSGAVFFYVKNITKKEVKVEKIAEKIEQEQQSLKAPSKEANPSRILFIGYKIIKQVGLKEDLSFEIIELLEESKDDVKLKNCLDFDYKNIATMSQIEEESKKEIEAIKSDIIKNQTTKIDKTKEFVKIMLLDYITDVEKKKNVKDLRSLIGLSKRDKVAKICEASTVLLSQKMQQKILNMCKIYNLDKCVF